MAYQGLAPLEGNLQRIITSGQENITSSIDNMELPFYDELKQYAEVPDTDFHTWMNKIKGLLSDLNNLNVTYATLLLDPTLYNDVYASSILSQLETVITTNLSAGGSGLPAEWEDATYQRARNRVLLETTRETRRIITDIAKRVPYAGLVSDAIIEADRNVVLTMSDKDREILAKQLELAYQNQRDKVKEAKELEQIKMEYFERRRTRSLQAYEAHDRNEILDHWKYFEFLMGRALEFAKTVVALLALMAKGPDQLTFENWMEMSKTMAEGQLRIAALVSNLLPSSQSV